MVSTKLNRLNYESEQRTLWNQIHQTVSVTTGDDDILVFDLVKFTILSPFIKDVLDTLLIPSSLKHLLDVNIMLPDFTSDNIVALVDILEGREVKGDYNQVREVKDLVKVLDLKVGLLKDGVKINSIKNIKPLKRNFEVDTLMEKENELKTIISSSRLNHRENNFRLKTNDTMDDTEVETRIVKFRSTEEDEPCKKKTTMSKGVRSREIRGLRLTGGESRKEEIVKDFHIGLQFDGRFGFDCELGDGGDYRGGFDTREYQPEHKRSDCRVNRNPHYRANNSTNYVDQRGRGSLDVHGNEWGGGILGHGSGRSSHDPRRTRSGNHSDRYESGFKRFPSRDYGH